MSYTTTIFFLLGALFNAVEDRVDFLVPTSTCAVDSDVQVQVEFNIRIDLMEELGEYDEY